MTTSVQNQIEIDMLGGETYQHHYVPWTKIGLQKWTPELPGIYSWHVRVSNRLSSKSKRKMLSFLADLHQQNKLEAEVRGNLGLTYEGTLKRMTPTLTEPSELLAHLMIMVSIPLYIGISNNLRQRLLTHKRQLQKALRRKIESGPNRLVEDELDTAQESEFFAKRLGSFLETFDFRDPDPLYVKFVVQSSFPTKEHHQEEARSSRGLDSELRSTEKYANHLFTPVFGRR